MPNEELRKTRRERDEAREEIERLKAKLAEAKESAEMFRGFLNDYSSADAEHSERVARENEELREQVKKLRARSPRTTIEGVACECSDAGDHVYAMFPWGGEWEMGVFGRSSTSDVEIMGIDAHLNDDENVTFTPDQAELFASKLHWCARVARGEDVSDHDRPGLVAAEDSDELRHQVMMLYLWGRPAGIPPAPVSVYEELEAAGYVKRDGAVWITTKEGERLWRGE